MQTYYRIKRFDPSGKTFLFDFTDNECSEVATGICDLDSGDSEARCSKMINLIKMHPNITSWCPITLFKYRCGHYDFDDGRHRVCSAIKLGNTIDVDLWEDDGLCQKCSTLE